METNQAIRHLPDPYWEAEASGVKNAEWAAYNEAYVRMSANTAKQSAARAALFTKKGTLRRGVTPDDVEAASREAERVTRPLWDECREKLDAYRATLSKPVAA